MMFRQGCCRCVHTSARLANRKVKATKLVQKRTWDAVRKEKESTPSNLALKFFDFQYAPLLGRLWPSVRLALLSDRKYVALVNTLHEQSDEVSAQLEAAGGFELMTALRQQRVPSGCVLDDDQVLNVLQAKMEPSDTVDDSTTVLSGSSSSSSASRRDASGLTDFMPVTQVRRDSDEVDYEQLAARHREEYERDQARRTGHVPQTWSDEFELVSVPDAAPVYPAALKVYAKRTADVQRFGHFPVLRSAYQGWYLVNGASLLPVLALNLVQGDRVLDMCAAPGGKSLACLLTKLPGELVCNDNRLPRLNALRNMLLQYVPDEHRHNVRLSQRDAQATPIWRTIEQQDRYDKILVDVPCNTDRDSLVSDDSHNPFSRTKNADRQRLPEQQTTMLYNALLSVRPGGSVVYSTCTLSPTQNEAVVHTATTDAYRKHGIRTVCRSLLALERHIVSVLGLRLHDGCRWGTLVLPHLPDNYGPMYVCKLQRLPDTQAAAGHDDSIH